MALRWRISLALLGNHMDDYGSFYLRRLTEYPQHPRDVMPIDWPQIGNAHIFKQHAWDQQLLNAALGLADMLYHPLPINRDFLQGICDAAL